MALERVVYPQEQYGPANLGLLQGEQESSFLGMLEQNESSSCNSMMQNQVKEYNNWDISNYSSSQEGGNNNVVFLEGSSANSESSGCRRKRRRTFNNKKKEKLEKQRMVHIGVERNRRKQMNEYLTLLRSLMPPSYVQRADQASIIGGAINFVKELERHIQILEAQNTTHQQQQQSKNDKSSAAPLFADFISFTHYSNRPTTSPAAIENRPVMDDIEVKLVENHANLKILSKRRVPKQLMKIVAGLQCVWLTILHLNVTTVDQMVLYSLSAKLEEGCQLTTVAEIAEAVNQLLGRIQEEATSNWSQCTWDN